MKKLLESRREAVAAGGYDQMRQQAESLSTSL